MLDTIKGLFSKIAEIFKKEKVAITERVEPTIQKETPKETSKPKKEPQIEEIREIKKQKVLKETSKEKSSEVINETKAHSRENREKKFEHSPIVDKDIWE